jgi:hypothetical protein
LLLIYILSPLTFAILSLLLSASPSLRLPRGLDDLCLILIGPICGGSRRKRIINPTVKQRLLVGGVDRSTWSTILVSGVEEIDTSPEDPIASPLSPVPWRGISGLDPLLVVSIVTAPGSTPN